jgi:hypothetical protein
VVRPVGGIPRQALWEPQSGTPFARRLEPFRLLLPELTRMYQALAQIRLKRSPGWSNRVGFRFAVMDLQSYSDNDGQ